MPCTSSLTYIHANTHTYKYINAPTRRIKPGDPDYVYDKQVLACMNEWACACAVFTCIRVWECAYMKMWDNMSRVCVFFVPYNVINTYIHTYIHTACQGGLWRVVRGLVSCCWFGQLFVVWWVVVGLVSCSRMQACSSCPDNMNPSAAAVTITHWLLSSTKLLPQCLPAPQASPHTRARIPNRLNDSWIN